MWNIYPTGITGNASNYFPPRTEQIKHEIFCKSVLKGWRAFRAFKAEKIRTGVKNSLIVNSPSLGQVQGQVCPINLCRYTVIQRNAHRYSCIICHFNHRMFAVINEQWRSYVSTLFVSNYTGYLLLCVTSANKLIFFHQTPKIISYFPIFDESSLFLWPKHDKFNNQWTKIFHQRNPTRCSWTSGRSFIAKHICDLYTSTIPFSGVPMQFY